MHNEIKIKESLYYVGASDRRLALFENIYPLHNGISYNSFLYLDEKTCLLDTVDRSVSDVFYENISYLLGDRNLDYLIVNHMEPDHAANIGELLLRHKETTIVLSAMAKKFLLNYFPKIEAKFLVVKEGDTFSIGKHRFRFISAPMVHWPEVMFTYEENEKILYSADAFGTFGALNGNLFADMPRYKEEHLLESRRYYSNIVGKYGEQVNAVLQKASALDIETIAPLHGPLLKGNLNVILSAYQKWASYLPEEEDAVMIVYSSIYGNTANATDILANKLAERGIKNIAVYDVSKTDRSVLIAEAWRARTLVLSATTYNAGVFIKMEDFLRDLAEHSYQNRTIAFLENGSWAPVAKANMQKILSPLKNIHYIESSLTIVSALKEEQLIALDTIAEAIKLDMKKEEGSEEESLLDKRANFALSYGLYLLFTKGRDEKDNASVNNSFFQISDMPKLYVLSVNRSSQSASTILETGVFNISCLTEEADYSLIKRFGFQSGRNVDKMAGFEKHLIRTSNGLLRLLDTTNAFFSMKVKQTIDCGDHILFLAEPIESKKLSEEKNLTYEAYFRLVKPASFRETNATKSEKKTAWRCKICGYTYVGETLPSDFVCPLCKHPASDFEKIEL